MTATDPVVFLSYARTPMGGMQGALSDASATDLGATAVKAAVERAGVSGDDIERIYMGCVLPAGLGQAAKRVRRRSRRACPSRCRRPRSTRCAVRACRPSS